MQTGGNDESEIFNINALSDTPVTQNNNLQMLNNWWLLKGIWQFRSNR